MARSLFLITAAAFVLMINSCTTKYADTQTAHLIFRFKFDSAQARLDNFGQPAAIPAGNSGQSPRFNSMSAHYAELTPTALTPLGSGDVLYKAPEVTTGGSSAIDFSKAMNVGEGQTFISVPLNTVTPGSYQYLRISLAYQNYDITFGALGQLFSGTVASFIGFDTYISSYKIKDSSVTVNANKLQGYWGFENIYKVITGQAAKTTVPNPIASTSPVPAGSCVVTGAFAQPLIITGNETKDIVVTVSLSTNKSFEWKDANGNGIYEPLDGDSVVNMGIRGLIPVVN